MNAFKFFFMFITLVCLINNAFALNKREWLLVRQIGHTTGNNRHQCEIIRVVDNKDDCRKVLFWATKHDKKVKLGFEQIVLFQNDWDVFKFFAPIYRNNKLSVIMRNENGDRVRRLDIKYKNGEHRRKIAYGYDLYNSTTKKTFRCNLEYEISYNYRRFSRLSKEEKAEFLPKPVLPIFL